MEVGENDWTTLWRWEKTIGLPYGDGRKRLDYLIEMGENDWTTLWRWEKTIGLPYGDGRK